MIVTTVLQDGLHVLVANDAVAPAGRLDAESATGRLLLPELSVALMVSVADAPACTDRLPELDNVKLNGWRGAGDGAGAGAPSGAGVGAGAPSGARAGATVVTVITAEVPTLPAAS